MRKLSDKQAKGKGQRARGALDRTYRLLPIAYCLLLFTIHFLLFTAEGFAQPPSPFAVDKLSGQRAPDFTLKDINGKPVSLSSFKGKVVLLNFWATWCPPCRAEIPSMNKLYQKLKNRGFVILAVSTDRAVIDVKDFLETTPINFPVVVDYNLTVSRNLYKVFMMPTTFLIDKMGTKTIFE
ncbi:MAG: TlpA family protein disulfide reductase, partial [Nitrospirae bacterium]|nr:TlpA family protein disulfide reductase [Nitrospirota bacterium]